MEFNLFGNDEESEQEEEKPFVTEIKIYKSEKRPPKEERNQFDALAWWKNNKTRFPYFYNQATKYLCIRSSQADVERDNSFLKGMITDKRNRLKSTTVSQLLFIRNNIKYFKQHFR